MVETIIGVINFVVCNSAIYHIRLTRDMVNAVHTYM